MTRFHVRSVDETVKVGEDFAKSLKSDSIVLLYGEMGAGKTHFIKGMAKGLNVPDTITSPTFALVNEHRGLTHFDLFRIHGEDDLYAIGFYDYIGKSVLAIEWSENIPDPDGEFDEYYTVKLEKLDETKTDGNERVITIDYTRT